jgi:large subunit ribosomal protein L9
MKIILTVSIPQLGKIGDIIEVKNGYARNFLIPSNKAIPFTENNSAIFESKKQFFEQENQKNLDLATKFKAEIFGKDIIIIENASDDGRLYGSVNSAVIAAKINQIIGKKFVSRSSLFLKKPIKEIGIYEVKLTLYSEVSLNLKVIVTRSESEIESLLKAEKEKQKAEKKLKEQELENQNHQSKQKEDSADSVIVDSDNSSANNDEDKSDSSVTEKKKKTKKPAVKK